MNSQIIHYFSFDHTRLELSTNREILYNGAPYHIAFDNMEYNAMKMARGYHIEMVQRFLYDMANKINQ